MLVRKLSYRPTIQELKEKRIIKFCDYIEVTDVEDYDRSWNLPPAFRIYLSSEF